MSRYPVSALPKAAVMARMDGMIRAGMRDSAIAEDLGVERGVVHSRMRELMREEVRWTPEEAAAWAACEAALREEAGRRGIAGLIASALAKARRAVGMEEVKAGER